ncbi:hypothetical protein pb186bvf_007369 [Paramecium bursaria]
MKGQTQLFVPIAKLYNIVHLNVEIKIGIRFRQYRIKGHAQNCQPNDYEEIKEIGHGTYGRVMLVQRVGIYYAMKIIPKGLFKEVTNSQLQKEISIHKKMDHENIIKLYSFSQDRESLKMVMEYAEGGPLLIQNIQESEILYYFSQICSGIKYLHQNHIIHRDLKPENILLKNQIVKLCDFGWSVEVENNQYRDTMCGTFEYMAPEITKGKYNNKVDLWSLGVILYEMYHKKHPKYPYQFDCPDLARDLIEKLLTDQQKRLTIDQVFEHPYLSRTTQEIDFTQFQIDELNIFDQLNNKLDQLEKQIPRATKILKPRQSRRVTQEQPQQKKTFFNQILYSIGCVNRLK